MRTLQRLCLFLAVIFLCSAVCVAQTPAKEPTASVSGHLTVAGKPAAGIAVVATLSVSFFDNKTVAKATTDEDGNYKLAGLAAGRFTIVPLSKAYVVESAGAYKQPGQTVNVAAGEAITKIDFALVRGNQKGEFALRNLEAARYRLEIKLPTESWYVRAINLPGAAARAPQPTGNSALPVAANANLNNWQGVVTVKSGEQIKDVSIMVGQDAAGVSGRLETDGAAIREGTLVHLVPVDREQANNILRYSETVVKSDGSLSLTNIAPGHYFVLPRIEPASEPGITARPVAWAPIARAKLRREAEAANIIVELKPCQRLVDYALKFGAAVQ